MRLILVVTSWSLVSTVLGHPQCLDFKPPFENDQELSFCSQYSEFGCCHPDQDAELELKYVSLRVHLTDSSCHGMLKELLCQQCSPYAIHIYDAEVSGVVNRTFPGICQQYCHNLMDTCPGIVPLLTNNPHFLKYQESKDEFCHAVALPDVDYCYPNLLTDPRLTGDLERVQWNTPGCLCLEEFARDLANPLIFRTILGDERIFVGEQQGRVYIYYQNKTKLNEPFLEMDDLVLTSGSEGDERGFLGLALHPNFTGNQKLYVYFSVRASNGQEKIRISEFQVNKTNPDKVNRTSERVLLEVVEPWWNHNGGEILFGVDGYLYAFIGDGGSGGDPRNYAQNKNTLLGKVIRIDVDNEDPSGSRAYAIPEDNPFINEVDARPEIYAYGVRNIWRCDVDEGDPQTGEGRGRIFCGDVGQSRWEEIDIIEKGGNLGWNSREGFECYQSSTCGRIGPEVLPIFAYSHSEGRSVTGGHVYRGCENPNLQGFYIYGDFMDGRLWYLKEDKTTQPSTWANEEIFMCQPDTCLSSLKLTSYFERNILSFGEDQNGEIYMLTTSFASSKSHTGKIYKLIDPRRRGDPRTCRSYVPPPTTTMTTPDFVFPTDEDLFFAGSSSLQFSLMLLEAMVASVVLVTYVL